MARPTPPPSINARGAPGASVPILKLSGPPEELMIGETVQIYTDRRGEKKFDEIRNLPSESWTSAGRTRLTFGINDSHHWGRIRIQNISSRKMKFYFAFMNGRQDHIDFYHTSREDAKFTHRVEGDNYPFLDREVLDNNFSHLISLQPGEIETIYFCLKGNRSFITARPTLWGVDVYTYRDGRARLMRGVYLGILFVMLLYNLFLFVSIRETALLSYLLYILMNLFLALALEGVGFAYLYPDWPVVQSYDVYVLIPLVVVFGLSFSTIYLNLEEQLPLMYVVLKYIVYFFMIVTMTFPTIFIHINPGLTLNILNIITLPPMILILSLGVYLSYRGFRPAWFYTTAWSFLLGGAILRVMGSAQLIPTSVITEWSLQFGGALEVTLLSFGLADRVNTLKNRLSLANTELEEKVQERTQDLRKILGEVRALKHRQDGDYFLTSQLLRPLGLNRVKSDSVEVEFLVRQKKRFTYRKWREEIGGDICVAYQIKLRGVSYVVFINGDAMGKSLQGAGGALVLGAVFDSIVERTRKSRHEQNLFPERWLKNVFEELRQIFETFEGGMLISAVMGLVDEGNGVIYQINAEHPRTALYREGTAEFIKGEEMYHKLGSRHDDTPLSILVYPLKPGDMIFVGSDGRDDIMKQNSSAGGWELEINDHEFLRRIEEGRGRLKKVFRAIRRSGKIIDDISILRLEYKGILLSKERAPKERGSRTSGENENRLTVLYEKARKAYQNNELESALKILGDSLRIAPFERELTRLLVKILRARREYERAAGVIEGYLRVNPWDRGAVLLGAFVFMEAGDLDLAADYAERLQLRDPGNIRYLLGLFEIYLQAENFLMAENILAEISRKSPPYPKLPELKTRFEILRGE